MSSFSSFFFVDEQVDVSASQTLTNLTIIIQPVRYTNVFYSQCTVPSGRMSCSGTISLTHVIITFTLQSGQTISPGITESVVGIIRVPALLHTVSNDTYTVIGSCNGGTSTATGTF